MKPALKMTIVVSVAFLFGGSMAAQESATAIVVSQPAPALHRGAITGEPYSAHTEMVHTQTLEDGTRIERKMNVENSFRDSQGRTRTERYIAFPDAQGEPNDLISVMIHDPTTDVTYLLNPHDHTARELTAQPALFLSGNAVSVQSPSAAVTSGGVVRIQSGILAQQERPHPKITTVDLGTQEMEGVVATGTRTTMEYPAGIVGNDRPFSVITERWQSDELKLMILTKRTDPRSGESVTRVTNLDRNEPDASLFQVPEDYTITKEEIVPANQQ